jgi:hypothetical protein
MADTPDLGSGPARGGGSSPLSRTNFTREAENSSAGDTNTTQETPDSETENMRLTFLMTRAEDDDATRANDHDQRTTEPSDDVRLLKKLVAQEHAQDG